MIKREKIAVVSGCYDPLSKEDSDFLKLCKSKADWLIVGLHSDFACILKKGTLYFDYETRLKFLESRKFVDEVFHFEDSDGTSTNLLKIIKGCYPTAHIFYVSSENMEDAPETKVRGITFVTLKQE